MYAPERLGGSTMIQYLIDACFWVDMAIQFRTAFHQVEDDSYVCDVKAISQRYKRSHFKRDLFAVLPWEVIVAGIDQGGLRSLAAHSHCALVRALVITIARTIARLLTRLLTRSLAH